MAEKKLVIPLEDVEKLVDLAKELASELRSLEGETPSSKDADKYIAQCIAKVEKRFR